MSLSDVPPVPFPERAGARKRTSAQAEKDLLTTFAGVMTRMRPDLYNADGSEKDPIIGHEIDATAQQAVGVISAAEKG